MEASTASDRSHSTVDQSLEDFLAEIQARALGMARLSTRDADEALDLVQDAMTAFVRHYADKPAVERRPLFYRILDNRITDWHRRRQRWRRWLVPVSAAESMADGPDPVAPGPASMAPDGAAMDSEFGDAVEAAIARLPQRQRQVFLLRAWEGLDVAETARALGIGTGSVKTHHFRALASLRRALEVFDDRT